jgi:hypothetical protein
VLIRVISGNCSFSIEKCLTAKTAKGAKNTQRDAGYLRTLWLGDFATKGTSLRNFAFLFANFAVKTNLP